MGMGGYVRDPSVEGVDLPIGRSTPSPCPSYPYGGANP